MVLREKQLPGGWKVQLLEKKQNVKKTVYAVEGNYGFGWETIVEEVSDQEAKKTLKDYKKNANNNNKFRTRKTTVSKNVISYIVAIYRSGKRYNDRYNGPSISLAKKAYNK